MPYNTGNAMPSKDPRDLYDNATNFDNFSNGSAATYPDRFGVPRRSLAGFGMAFDESQLARDSQFQAFLVAAGYVWIGDYAAGVTFTTRNQYTVRSGLTYRVAPETSLPYTLTGTWATDQPKLVLLETAGAILSQLAANTGAGLIGTTEAITVQAALDARLKSNIFAASTNLNTLYTAPSVGIYRQSSDASATTALNYPVAGVGGTLEVYIGVSDLALQEFTTKTLRKFIRWCSSSTGPTWTAWREITLPPGGTVGQSLINNGSGSGVWGEPTILDAGTSPNVRMNLTVSYVSRNDLNPIPVTADRLAVTDVNSRSLLLNAFSQTAQQGLATTGLNSLDTGTWGAGEYHLFAIYNPATLVRGLLWSRSSTAPTLPAGFTHKAYLSANMRAATGNIQFSEGVQYGNRFYCSIPTSQNVLTSGVVGAITVDSVTWVASSVSTLVPATAVVALVLMQSQRGGAGGGSVAVAPNSAYGGPRSAIPTFATTLTRGSDPYTGLALIPLQTRDIYVAASGASCSTVIMGWELNL